MDSVYIITLFIFQPWYNGYTQEEAYDNVTKRLEEIKILLGEKIYDPIVIVCIHREKNNNQLMKKSNFKGVQEDEVKPKFECLVFLQWMITNP